MDLVWKDASDRVQAVASKPDKFFDNSSKEPLAKAKVCTKVFYDSAKLIEDDSDKAAAATTLPQLVIDDFDCEQVWAGLELQNKAMLGSFSNRVHDLLAALGGGGGASTDLSLFAKPVVKSTHSLAESEEVSDQEDLKDVDLGDTADLLDEDDTQQDEEVWHFFSFWSPGRVF